MSGMHACTHGEWVVCASLGHMCKARASHLLEDGLNGRVPVAPRSRVLNLEAELHEWPHGASAETAEILADPCEEAPLLSLEHRVDVLGQA